MNNLDAIMADLLELEPELKNKEPQVRAIVSAMLKARPDTQFDQTFADKLKAQLLATDPEAQEPAAKRAWHFSVPAWSLASVSAAAILLVAVAQLDLEPNATPTIATNTPATARLARNAFGALQFTSNVSTGMERGGGGEESSRLADDNWTPTIYEYILPDNWAENLQLPTEAPVYTVGRGVIAGDLSDMLSLNVLRNLNLSVFNVSAENSERNISVSYDTINNALMLYFNNALYETPQTPDENTVWLSEEELVAKAESYAMQYGVSLENTTDAFLSDQIFTLYARASAEERKVLPLTIAPPTNVTVTFRQTVNGLPVYWNGETQISLNPTNGELISLTTPLKWHADTESTYATLTDTNQLATYFRWGGTVDPTTWFPEQNVIKQQVQLEQPKLIYSHQNICKEQPGGTTECSAYLVPSLSATVVPTEENPWANEVIIPLSTNQP